jgi:hypothetical protein
MRRALAGVLLHRIGAVLHEERDAQSQATAKQSRLSTTWAPVSPTSSRWQQGSMSPCASLVFVGAVREHPICVGHGGGRGAVRCFNKARAP